VLITISGLPGSGKTTVALHRLRALRMQGNERFRAACVVPNEGLRRLAESLLHRLGLTDVETWTWDKFASKQARRVFPDLRRRESEETRPLVSRLKRHEALRGVLRAIACRPPPPQDDADTHRRAKRAVRDDLHALFGDRSLMEDAAGRAGLPLTAAAEIVEHTRVQFTQSTEREYAHVDEERLVTADGRAIDEGTPLGDAETVDVEDYAVLFELERMRAQNAGVAPASPARYHCLLIDEAQEFSPLELSLLGRCVARGGTLIVAGDAAQQIDAAANFGGWDATMRELARVLKPGGRLIFSTWDTLERNPFARITNNVLKSMFPEDPPTFYRTPFGDADPAELQRRTEAAGFRDVTVENVAFESMSESAEHFAKGLIRGNPVSIAIGERGGATHEEVERKVAEALRRELGDRPVRNMLHAWVVTGTA